MSDSWYKDPPPEPPPIEHMGHLWTWDGRCLNPDAPPPDPTWLNEWPEDLRYTALQASVTMELLDEYKRALWPGLDTERDLT